MHNSGPVERVLGWEVKMKKELKKDQDIFCSLPEGQSREIRR